MASPIVQISSSAITNVSTNSSPSIEMPASQPSKSPQNDSVSTVSSPQKDTVQISQEAISLSKDLNDSGKLQSPARQTAVKPSDSLVATQTSKDSGITNKSFPPFIGDNNELKQLKQTSPALYREILKMIMPPPLDLTYYEQQMLKGPDVNR